MENSLHQKPFREIPRTKKTLTSRFFIFTLLMVLAFGILSGGSQVYASGAVQFQAVQPQAISISQLYQNVQDSVVVITDQQPQTSVFGQSYALVQGSGFVYNLNGQMVIITNYHVINQAVNISVTFRNGNGYAASVLGADPYADLAVVSANAPVGEFKPLQIVSSSILNVGDFVAAFGSPFGLSGSLTTGIVSALGRTITETTAGNFPIPNVIQTDAPINPGNSGGPLLNGNGQAVGINTATVSGSTGVGFAIPSDTILREINSLVTTGTYARHSYLGIGGADMNYDIARQAGLSVTYGVLLQQVTSGGPADKAGLKAGATQAVIDGTPVLLGGDIIIAFNGSRIINTDGLSSYIEQNTLPTQTVTITIVRNGQTMDLTLILGTRPLPSGFSPPSPQPVVSSAAIPEASFFVAIAAVTVGMCVVLVIVKKKQMFN